MDQTEAAYFAQFRGDDGSDGEPARTGFWYTTESGNTAHIQGDPDMPQETLDMLDKMIDAAIRKRDKEE